MAAMARRDRAILRLLSRPCLDHADDFSGGALHLRRMATLDVDRDRNIDATAMRSAPVGSRSSGICSPSGQPCAPASAWHPVATAAAPARVTAYAPPASRTLHSRSGSLRTRSARRVTARSAGVMGMVLRQVRACCASDSSVPGGRAPGRSADRRCTSRLRGPGRDPRKTGHNREGRRRAWPRGEGRKACDRLAQTLTPPRRKPDVDRMEEGNLGRSSAMAPFKALQHRSLEALIRPPAPHPHIPPPLSPAPHP